MKLLRDLSEYDWVANGIVETEPSTVAHCLPSIYPAYAKVFHAIYEDLSVQDDQLTWQDEDKARAPGPEPKTETQRALAEALSGSTLVYGGARPDARLVQLRWAELTRRLGMPFVPTLSAASFTRQFPGGSWPRHLIGPDEGNLVGSERAALVSILRGHTETDRILFRFWFLATTDWGGGDKMFEGTLDEADLFPDKRLGVRCTPTHWFPENRRWLVCSDYDLTFSLVGGSEHMIQQLLDHPALECVRVVPNTRVD
jgi:hypothetical protein